MKTQFTRYLDVPSPGQWEHALNVGQHVFCFNLSMETSLDIVYQRLAQYSVFDKIGATPTAILSYCTYRFWAEEMQAPMGHIHDDVWCQLEEDFGDQFYNTVAPLPTQDKALAYIDAVMALVNEVYPFFQIALTNFMKSNDIFSQLGGDADLQLSGVFGYVANFTLLTNV